MDMSGGAAVLEAVAAIAELELPVNLLAVIPSTENMPSGHAIKPGDIITQLNGKTVEVNNTDAEGRLILADALAYSVEQGAERIIDLATLTGAVLVALGSTYAALISNDDELGRRGRVEAAERTGELAWRLPLHPEYKELTKGTRRRPHQRRRRSARPARSTRARSSRSSSTARPWVHLDIAGTAWDVGPRVRRQGPDGLRRPAAGRAGARPAAETLDRQQPQHPARERRRRRRCAPGRWRGARAPRGPAASAGSGTPPRRPPSVGTVAKWTMSGRRPAITRSGLRRSPSSTTTTRGPNVIRSGEKSSAKRKTTRPRISAASSGSRAMPRSIRPKMLGATPSSTILPSRTLRRRSVPLAHRTIVRCSTRPRPRPCGPSSWSSPCWL